MRDTTSCESIEKSACSHREPKSFIAIFKNNNHLLYQMKSKTDQDN